MGRKGKTMPASSKKALEVCGDTSKLGVSAADIFAQFSSPAAAWTPAEETANASASSVVLEDKEISMALHSLQKKDPTTRLRGVAELQQLLSSRSQADLREVATPFLNIYRRLWPQDSEPRVREGIQRCLQILVETLHREFARHLRSAFPTWLCAMFDTHTEVTQAARRAFAASFQSDEKKRGVFRHCRAECLALLSANLRHSEQSLHEELGLTAGAAGDKNVALERQDRYARVLAASLSGLGELINICSASTADSQGADGSSQGAAEGAAASAVGTLAEEELAPFFTVGSPCALWLRLAPKQPALARRAAAECLARVLQSPAGRSSSVCRSTQVRSGVLCTLGDEAVPPAIASVLLCRFAEAGGEDCWDGVNIAKALWPQLITLAKRGASREVGFLGRLAELLHALPAEAWAPGRGEALLRILLEALQAPRSPKAELWRGYLAVVKAADAGNAPVPTVWRWAPITLYLRGEADPADATGAAAGQADTHSVDDLPISALPSATCTCLREILGAELPALIRRPEDAEDMLEAFARCTPPVDPLILMQGSVRTAWASWIALFVQLLRLPVLPENLQVRASDMIAERFRTLLTSTIRLPIPESISAINKVLDSLSSFLCVDMAPERSWAPARDAEFLQALQVTNETLQMPDDAATAEEWLLSWPLLPWWRLWTVADPSGDAASAVGVQVLRPFLSAALTRLGNDFPVEKIRESIARVMLQMPSAAASGSREDITSSPEAPLPPLSCTVRLYLECLPAEMSAASSPVLELAVDRLTCLVVQGERSSEAAWKLALRPGEGALSADKVCQCLDVLMQAVEDQAAGGSSGRVSQLALLSGEILADHARCTGGAAACLQRFFHPVCRVLLDELVCRGSADTKEEQRAAWELLPGLLAGIETAALCEMLGLAPAESAARDSWVRAVRLASTATGDHPVLLLCMCRGDLQSLHLDGQISLSDLCRNSMATQGVLALGSTSSLFPSSEGEGTTAAFLLFWEVLLVDAVLPELAVRTDSVQAWLQAASASLQRRFLQFCTEAAMSEGQKWWLSLASGPGDPSDASCRYSLSVLRKVFAMLWEHYYPATQDIPGADRLSEVWSGISDCHSAGPNWGKTMATVLEQHAYLEEITALFGRSVALRELDERQRARLRSLEQELNTVDSEQAEVDASAGGLSAKHTAEALTARTKMRQAVNQAISSQQVCAALLHVACAVELWATRIPDIEPLDEDKDVVPGEHVEDGKEVASEEAELSGKSVRELKQILVDRGITPALPPVEKQEYITAIVAAGPQQPVVSDEELSRNRRSAKLIEAHERLLRWSQSSRSLDERDAFAAYTAALWPAISAATPEISSSSKVVTRMHRLALELLSDAKDNKRCKALPGGLKLVATLAQARLWPDSSWTAVLQAIMDADMLARAESCNPLHSEADEEDCSSSIIEKDPSVMTSLPISQVFVDEVLAAAARLLQHVPVALLPKVVPLLAAAHPSLQAAAASRLRLQHWVSESDAAEPGTSSKALQLQFEGVLLKGEASAETPPGDDAACRDVIFAVLLAAVGPELSAEAWVVDRALADFLEWEAEVQAAEANADASESDQEQTGKVAVTIASGTSAELPAYCRRRCVATLAAWELVLLGLQQSRAPAVERGSNDESEPMSLPEIVAAALQVTPDQMVGSQARKGWPSVTAPPLEAASPLPLLLRLLCHVLTCKRIADEASTVEADVQDMMQRVASDGLLPVEKHGFDIFTLAARVFYLLLRAMPAAARGFWEHLPRRRDRDLVERLVANSFSSILAQAEVQGAGALLKARAEKFPDVEASVVRRKEQIVLQLERDDLRAEVCVQVPEAFPLKMATAEQPEKMPGIPPKRIRNWMLQSRQVLSGARPPCVGRAMLMWARSFALFFDGVEDCPICYNVVHLSTQTIPRKACPTCKHKFHNECLYHWFRTSAKTTCPLCNQPF